MFSRKLLFFAALVLFPAPALVAQTPSFPVPSTFTATLPCADCPAIHESLTILPGGIYFDRLVYEGRRSTFESLGRWSLSSGGSLLSLRASSASDYSILDPSHLRKLAPEGSHIPAMYLPTFTRSAFPAIPSVAFSIRGDYSSAPADSHFTDCASNISLPIAAAGDSAALERAYSAAQLKSGATLFVTLSVRIVLEKDPSGRASSAALEVVRVAAASPTDTCSSPPRS